MSDLNTIAAWFDNERGIKRETLTAFRVGFDGRNVLLPYPNGMKERPDPTKPLPEGVKRFYFEGGKVPELFIPPDNPVDGVAYLVEGETDTMRLWQVLRAAGHSTAIFGIGGVNTFDSWLAEKYLRNYSQIFTILDNDDDYIVRAQVDHAWRKIRSTVPAPIKRIYLPGDVKDVCEFFDRYDLEVFAHYAQARGVSRFKPLDLTLPPPPTDWLLNGWVAMGDLVVLVGDGGLGKSWLTMAIAISVLSGADSCLGQAMPPVVGPVLYVDEENPQDVVYNRMYQLGFDPAQHMTNLRYLWNQGIKLDRNPDVLIDEGLDFRPRLTVLDSLTRLHSKEENSSGDIGPLLNDSVKPLARDVGSAVILIHHHDKSASGPRGSTDIRNASDAVIECYKLEAPGQFRMRLTKSRRVMTGTELIVTIQDQPDGSVKLRTDAPREYVF